MLRMASQMSGARIVMTAMRAQWIIARMEIAFIGPSGAMRIKAKFLL